MLSLRHYDVGDEVTCWGGGVARGSVDRRGGVGPPGVHGLAGGVGGLGAGQAGGGGGPLGLEHAPV